MSIASEIDRIQSNVAFAYDVCEAKGATMPAVQDQNSAHLASTIATISPDIEDLADMIINASIKEGDTT